MARRKLSSRQLEYLRYLYGYSEPQRSANFVNTLRQSTNQMVRGTRGSRGGIYWGEETLNKWEIERVIRKLQEFGYTLVRDEVTLRAHLRIRERDDAWI